MQPLNPEGSHSILALPPSGSDCGGADTFLLSLLAQFSNCNDHPDGMEIETANHLFTISLEKRSLVLDLASDE